MIFKVSRSTFNILKFSWLSKVYLRFEALVTKKQTATKWEYRNDATNLQTSRARFPTFSTDILQSETTMVKAGRMMAATV